MIHIKLFALALMPLAISCSGALADKGDAEETSPEMDKGFNAYWYQNKAELTSYKLEQARYGEIHQGHAVLVYVTEPFSNDKQVKADHPNPGDPSVLKLNFTKKFNTGVYPYSMMMSSFVPVDAKKEMIKLTTSVQEWCGHVYSQLNNRNGKYEMSSYSYFESEGDQQFSLEKDVLEDELWTRIRFDPAELPTGSLKIVPGMFYTRLVHKEVKAYDAESTLEKGDNQSTYTIHYPKLDRTLAIEFNNAFPYEILGWIETYTSGWGTNAKKLSTRATRMESLQTDYWNRHNVGDQSLRQDLGLP